MGVIGLIGVGVMVLGTLFLALGGLGLVRMTDTYLRVQAGTKATTLGTILTLAGAVLIMPAWGIKLVLIALFLMFSNPLSSQVLARAAYRAGVPVSKEPGRDALEADLAADGEGKA